MLDQQNRKKRLLKRLGECWHLQQDIPSQLLMGRNAVSIHHFFAIFYVFVLWQRRDEITIKIAIGPRTCVSTRRRFC